MRIRDFEQRDIPAIRRMYEEAGFDYPLPDFTESQFTVRVLVDEGDVPVQVFAIRKTVEAYCLMDKSWGNPRWRLEGLMQGHEDMRQILEAAGVADVHAWLPPEVEKSFGRKLERVFGWIPSRWKSYSRHVKE